MDVLGLIVGVFALVVGCIALFGRRHIVAFTERRHGRTYQGAGYYAVLGGVMVAMGITFVVSALLGH